MDNHYTGQNQGLLYEVSAHFENPNWGRIIQRNSKLYKRKFY